ncbi:hypothetical protein NL676_017298 [Syzygium grande]|nr:hypothetical protein NL676_017298 [Syzygium grande]
MLCDVYRQGNQRFSLASISISARLRISHVTAYPLLAPPSSSFASWWVGTPSVPHAYGARAVSPGGAGPGRASGRGAGHRHGNEGAMRISVRNEARNRCLDAADTPCAVKS